MVRSLQSQVMKNSPTAYITTPIYYVNDKPHIGHVYTTTICDIWARYMRFAGRDVFFLTGTDEHGVKVEKSAREREVSPQALADENAAEFQRVLGTFQLTNNDFIRTTQDRHVRQVQHYVQRLIESDDVYLSEYEGWYDEGQEEFIAETKAAEQDYKSAISGKPLVRMKEANYFFRLSRYQKQLEELYEKNPDFVRPGARRNEMLGRMREGLQDVPVSRTSFSWGIPVPGDEAHVLWVWLDALSNYITTLGLGEPEGEVHAERAKYWPPAYHVIGKEILFFHALFWPAVLIALDIPLPRSVYAHSFWISEGQKMSKSLGNFIDLAAIERYLDTYGLDMWRYFLASEGPMGATDSDFSANHFHDIYSTDLVNTVGNCASRVTAMINKYFDGLVPSEPPSDNRSYSEDFNWPQLTDETVSTVAGAMERLELAGAIEAALSLVRRVDAFINHTEPFKLAKDETRRDELGAILYQCLETIRIASLLLWAVMPTKMATLWEALNIDIDPDQGKLSELTQWGGIVPSTQVTKIALFPRVDQPLDVTAV